MQRYEKINQIKDMENKNLITVLRYIANFGKTVRLVRTNGTLSSLETVQKRFLLRLSATGEKGCAPAA